MLEEQYPLPAGVRRADGTSRYAFVTFLMLNDSYLPGALMVAYALRRQATRADLVCLTTEGVTSGARYALELLFDHVVDVPLIYVPHKRRQERQDRPYMFTRMHALRLGGDGDLGFKYEKVVVLDADVLPLRRYEHLFTLRAPAGIINERKAHFVDTNPDDSYHVPSQVEATGKWKWHELYDDVCPHGHRIPRQITDRVAEDVTNLGINGSLFVFEPSMAEFRTIEEDVRRPEVLRLVGDLYDWPEMQYLTLRWSGRWTNVDLRFSGFNGYPSLSVLLGTHYAGFKPWGFKKPKAIARWARYDDFQLWYSEYKALVSQACPQLQKVRRLARLLRQIERLEVQ